MILFLLKTVNACFFFLRKRMISTQIRCQDLWRSLCKLWEHRLDFIWKNDFIWRSCYCSLLHPFFLKTLYRLTLLITLEMCKINNYYIFLRIYALKMYCGKRRKWYFLNFKNSPSVKLFRVLSVVYLFSRADTFKLSRYARVTVVFHYFYL